MPSGVGAVVAITAIMTGQGMWQPARDRDGSYTAPSGMAARSREDVPRNRARRGVLLNPAAEAPMAAATPYRAARSSNDISQPSGRRQMRMAEVARDLLWRGVRVPLE
jgi:hypothetical protein